MALGALPEGQIDERSMIGTGYGAISATDATLVIHHHKIQIVAAHGSSRAHVYAFGLRTMVAGNGNMVAKGISLHRAVERGNGLASLVVDDTTVFMA